MPKILRIAVTVKVVCFLQVSSLFIINKRGGCITQSLFCNNISSVVNGFTAVAPKN